VAAGHLAETFLVYLAFENSMCDDYVTEKLWNQLSSSQLVPVIMGQVNRSAIPPHSAIDAREFPGPRELPNYLKHLLSDDEEYQSYFWRRDHYRVMSSTEVWSTAFCKLCQMLNDKDLPARELLPPPRRLVGQGREMHETRRSSM
jgi:alpha-1,3-fucosyltransferase